MSVGRIVLFGATGYSGRLAARELVRAGAAPVLAARSADALTALVNELSDEAPEGREPSHDVADADRPETVRRLLRSVDDVLVSTVGPFTRLGEAAVSAAVAAGCAYIDCSGEPAFLRRVFEEHGPEARRTGARLLPGIGYDFVPGNLAGALAIDRFGGHGLARIDIGYFVSGPFTASKGTVASGTGIMLDPSFSYRGGKLRSERPGAGVRSFRVGDRQATGIRLGGSELLALPRLDPALERITVNAGWPGRWAWVTSAAGAVTANARAVPGLGSAMNAVVRTAVGGASGEGPPAHVRSRSRSVVVTEAFDSDGGLLGRVRVEGPNPYDLTAGLLSWSARMLARRAERGTGTLGPVDAFGLDALVSGCLALGLAESD